MSRVCQICGKGYQKGNLVPRGIGNRCTGRTIARNSINLRVKRFLINGKKVKFRLCSSCLKRITKEERDFLAISEVGKDNKAQLAVSK